MAASSPFLSAEEAAAYLGVSRATLYAYVSRGLIASEPARGSSSRARRYPRQSLDDLMAHRQDRRDPAAGALERGAPLLESSISLIEEGSLWYRGQDACELSRTASFEEVACLLWTGGTDGARALFPGGASNQRARRKRGSLGDRLVACLVEERSQPPLSLADPSPATLRAGAHAISALFDSVGATGSGSLAQRLARGWRAPSAADLSAALILCADHELNTSAFTARCVASTDAPIPNVLLAALCALEGRRHGGAASRDVHDLLDDIARLGVDEACGKAVARRGRLLGLGAHPLHPTGDPRALELLQRLDLPSSDPATQAIAFAREIGGRPSLELALVALARQAGLPEDAAFVLFALGRSAGWVAHALEAAARGTLIRPRARYIGPAPGQDAGSSTEARR